LIRVEAFGLPEFSACGPDEPAEATSVHMPETAVKQGNQSKKTIKGGYATKML